MIQDPNADINWKLELFQWSKQKVRLSRNTKKPKLNLRKPDRKYDGNKAITWFSMNDSEDLTKNMTNWETKYYGGWLVSECSWWQWTLVKGVELMTRREGTEEKGEDVAELKTRQKHRTWQKMQNMTETWQFYLILTSLCIFLIYFLVWFYL